MIRLTDIRYGPGFFQEPGSIVTLTPDEERALIDAKRAVPVETAAKPIPETATNKQRQRGKKQ